MYENTLEFLQNFMQYLEFIPSPIKNNWFSAN